jgi:steroid 5-alpha reductase family enzyme
MVFEVVADFQKAAFRNDPANNVILVSSPERALVVNHSGSHSYDF